MRPLNTNWLQLHGVERRRGAVVDVVTCIKAQEAELPALRSQAELGNEWSLGTSGAVRIRTLARVD